VNISSVSLPHLTHIGRSECLKCPDFMVGFEACSLSLLGLVLITSGVGGGSVIGGPR